MANTSEMKGLLLKNPISTKDPKIREFVLQHMAGWFPIDPARVSEIVASEIAEGTDSAVLDPVGE